MYEPALYRGQAFMMFHGRSTAMPEYRAGAALFAYMLPMIGVFGEDEDEHVRRLIKRNVDREYLVDAIKSACGIEGCVQLKAILSDPSVSSENENSSCFIIILPDSILDTSKISFMRDRR